jgi:hypothetical protein
MVLQRLATMEAQHAYNVARRIEQQSGDAVVLNQETIYAFLVRLQPRRLIMRNRASPSAMLEWLRDGGARSAAVATRRPPYFPGCFAITWL